MSTNHPVLDIRIKSNSDMAEPTIEDLKKAVKSYLRLSDKAARKMEDFECGKCMYQDWMAESNKAEDLRMKVNALRRALNEWRPIGIIWE